MPDEKITIKRLIEEWGIGENMAYKMFDDPNLPVQTYTRPKFVLRSELMKYWSVRHDNLCD